MDLDAQHRALVTRKRGLFGNNGIALTFQVPEDIWRQKWDAEFLLWLLGVPIPVIILLWLFFGR
jgi:hypothetical protein